MTEQNYTHVTLVVDRSGSMTSVKSDAQGAINKFLEEQRLQPGVMTFSMVQFDNVVDILHQFTPIENVKDYELIPRGWTALFDATGIAIQKTGEILSELPEEKRPGNVLVAVVTDGAENSSKEYTFEQLKKMIQDQQEIYGWHFAFLGADTSSWQGQNLGFGHVAKYDSNDTAAAYAVLSTSTSNLRAAGQFSMPDKV